jgi:hypothetical protein
MTPPRTPAQASAAEKSRNIAIGLMVVFWVTIKMAIHVATI